ncbi:Mak10 subunit, NatC N-terminal acetyltransferase-domain-containing protein [Hyaloraphidium curvatum]|nr:Mak10 subunit, NatC N-terminal acetyltransferase-domain-containing protein [Hyaloraphidium curvatum]
MKRPTFETRSRSCRVVCGAMYGPLESYRDITDIFTSATSKLSVGELLSADGFSLVDGMSAVEVMDPKMDSGTLLPPRSNDLLSVDGIGGLELLPEELLGTMDGILAREELWLRGDLLCQTVFTCVLLHRMADMKDTVLKAYLLATLKTCGLARDLIMRANIFTEEDFLADMSGFSLLEGVPEQTILDGLASAEEEASRRSRALANGANGSAGSQGDSAPNVWEAVVARLRFRRVLLQLVTHLAKGDGKGLPAVGKLLPNAKLQLALLTKTATLGADCERLFDENINRHLFATGPPRRVTPIAVAEALHSRESFLADLEYSLNVTGSTNFLSIMNHLLFLGLRTPSPNILARSAVVVNLVSQTHLAGRTELSKAAQQAIEQFSAPPYPSSNSKDAKSKFNHCCQRCQGPMSFILRAMCFNRPRNRRVLLKAVVEWEQLQAEAEEIDGQLQSSMDNISQDAFYISSWVYHIKLNIMDFAIVAGFELDLYSPHELPLVFAQWNVVAEAHVAHLERTEDLRLADARAIVKRTSQIANAAQQMQVLTAHRAFRLGVWHMSKAFFKLTAALISLGAIKEPSETTEETRIRFLQRFRGFQFLGSPTPFAFSDYVASLAAARQAPEASLKESIDLFQTARQHFTSLTQRSPAETQSTLCRAEYVANLQSLVKVCVANQVAGRVAAGHVTSPKGIDGRRLTVVAEPKHHRSLPTFTVSAEDTPR